MFNAVKTSLISLLLYAELEQNFACIQNTRTCREKEVRRFNCWSRPHGTYALLMMCLCVFFPSIFFFVFCNSTKATKLLVTMINL